MTPIVQGYVERQARQLLDKIFATDPLMTVEESQRCSFWDSAKKRHGRIIELVVREQLAATSRFKVWSPPNFRVPPEAEHLATLQLNGANITAADIAYTGQGKKRQVDIAAFDRDCHRLSGLEVKRAHGRSDAGKIRAIMRELYSTQAVLLGFGATVGLEARSAEARVICFYGERAVPAPWSLVGTELDAHFGCAIKGAVDDASDLFKRLIRASPAQVTFDFGGDHA